MLIYRQVLTSGGVKGEEYVYVENVLQATKEGLNFLKYQDKGKEMSDL